MEWHLVSPHDQLSADNGSAVLTVARALAEEGRRAGTTPLIVGGRGREDGLPGAVGLLRQPPSGSVVRVRDTASRMVRGRSGGDTLTVGDLPDGAPDLVVAHNLPWLGPALKERYPGATRVLYAHNRVLTRVPGPVARRTLSSFSGVVAVSTFVADDLVRRTGVDRSSVTPLLNGVDAACFDVAGDDGYDVLFVGRMVPEKGVDVLIDALVACHRAGVPLTLGVVGAHWFYGSSDLSPFERRLRSAAAPLGDAVTFLGRAAPAQMPAILATARIAVVPSVWPEPCGLTALEGLASQAALVTTDAGGLPEVVGGGARVVPKGDPDALAAALVELHRDDRLRADVAARGQERARALTWSRAYRGLTALCRQT